MVSELVLSSLSGKKGQDGPVAAAPPTAANMHTLTPTVVGAGTWISQAVPTLLRVP